MSNPYLLVPVPNPNGGGQQQQQNSNGTSAGISSANNTSSSIAQLSSTATNLAASSVNLIPQSSSNTTSASGSGSNSNPAGNTFRAPAHKHAHHLHSIPPREKSTRTLIIDHMLWVHGRTRFAQARAELGMTDRTGGPGTPQYAHRHRPENYEEEDDVGSDGEDAVTLKARAGDPGRPHNDDEDERLRSQDLALARSLRLRAEGLEKVVTSMLAQPPPEYHILDELLTPPTSPRIIPSGGRTPGPHVLPNGVRLRLALGTMINDLFARQAPVLPHRDRRQASAAPATPVASGSEGEVPDPAVPVALGTIATISAACPDKPDVQPWTRPSSSMRPGPGPMYPVQPRSPPIPSARIRALYNAGADPSTANSPPAFRCPRHLHTGCEICVEAKSTARPNGSAGGGGRGASSAASGQYWKAMPGGVSPEGGGITGWQDGCGIGSGLSGPAREGTVLRRKMVGVEAGDDAAASNGAGNTKLSELITRFLRLSAMVAAEMGREARGEEEEPASPVEDKEDADGDGDGDGDGEGEPDESPMLTEREGWEGATPDMEPLPPPATPVPAPAAATSVPPTPANPYENQTPMYGSALRPSREWYLLLAGLLTRAVLEGYLTAGWRGPDAVDCLLKVGLGMTPPPPGAAAPPKDEFAQFDPDELPSLQDAARMLFPAALRDGNQSPKGLAEEEFEMEMETRLRRFYDIPQSTPDLSTHMEDLAWQYPAEPVERAAVRFCEAIEKWRGKPELETYKKKPHAHAHSVATDTPGSSAMAIDAIVHNSPATSTNTNQSPALMGLTGPGSASGSGGAIGPPRSTRKPSIGVYFPQPFPRRQRAWNKNKRTRSPDGGRPSPAKVARNGTRDEGA
ncbi:hypothetical protein B0H16DRAFT_1540550 [Mycena metata]|uniref:Uncharacterized protein n=1 Tax=Mycena metata TaxID=1033252 RepID=A0AAD7J244_9AGAR|nr:hypothetical protein B0H16DRAFT_1540550 [Mycena metata]